MLSVTKTADADYYLRSACSHEQLLGEAVRPGPAEYELRAIEGGAEPAGQWVGRGTNTLGLVGEVSPEAFRTLVNDLRAPGTGEALGSRPRRFKSAEERMEAFDLKHPWATAEQREAARVRAEAKAAQAVHAYDLTFSLPKSWSVLHAALQRAGREDEAEQVWAAAQAGIHAALDQAAHEVGWSRTGARGPRVAGRVTTTHVRADDLIMAMFRHHTSRDRDPQLHAHVMLLNRVLCPDGSWRALHAAPLMKSKHMLDATFLRVAEGELTRRLGVRFAARPDGVAREVVGIDERVREMFSSRSRALTEDAQQLVDEYTARRGRPPSALLRWQFAQQATLATRRAKPAETPSRGEDLDRWEQQVAAEFREGLEAVLEGVDDTRADPDEAIVVEPLDSQVVIEQALADLEQRKATWNRSHLYHAISQRMPDMLAIEPAYFPQLAGELTDSALLGREVVALEAPAVARVPRSLQDARTRRSVFEAPEGQRFTTARHLAREDSLVERLDHRRPAALSPASARALLVEAGLDGEQLEVGVALASSDRVVELVDAAAGTGKTTLMAALSRASAQVWGHGLTGFAVAQTAAENLAEHGVERGHNIDRWLDFRDRATRGEVGDLERLAFAVPRGSIVVVDEASMVDTRRLTDLVGALEDAGVGKIVLIGDTQQVDAVDAGGGFAMLCGREAPHRLETVRRFSAGWERDASARLRDGDAEALAEYDQRARIRGDADEDTVRAWAVKAFCDDHLSGLESVVVVGSTKEAQTVSSHVRERLVRAGHVDRDGVRLQDRNVAGIGDLVQSRLNRHDLGILNRDVWQVVGTSSVGDLEVRRAEGRDETGARRWGAVRTLPAEYVRSWVELAYAGTVEAVQGRTTDTGHAVVDRLTGRGRAYSAGTRGRDGNHFWVVLDEGETALGRLAHVIETDDHTAAARVALAEEQDRADHLGHLGPQWQTIVTDDRAGAHRRAVSAALDPVDAAAVLADQASGGVLRLLRTAETTGHDPAALLAAAAERGSVATARSPASVLYRRLDDALAPHRGEDQRVAFTYLARTPEAADERMQYAREIAAAMDARTTRLGERVAEEPPEWALERWGPPPTDPMDRLGWTGRAAPVAAYREQFGWDHPRSPIGPQPTRAEPERLWAWNRAADVLGMDPRDREMAALSVGALANRVQRWDREQAWMPRHVGDDLREAHDALSVARGAVVAARTRGDDSTAERADEDAMVERIGWLEEIAEVRTRAYRATEAVREQADEARAELTRRRELTEAEIAEIIAPEPEAGPSVEVHAAVHERFRTQTEQLGMLDAAVPVFGSRRWVELDAADPRKAAAATRAAARWWNLGDPLDRDLDEVYARLAEHDEPPELEGAWIDRVRERTDDQHADVEADTVTTWAAEPNRAARLTSRALARVRAGADERDAADEEPSTDLDALVAVREWATPHMEPDAPAFGTVEWAELADDRQRDAAEARAALRWWNLGDDLDEVHERARRADDVASSHAVAAEIAGQDRDRLDRRSAAELAEARGDEPPPTVPKDDRDLTLEVDEQPEPDPAVRRWAVREARRHAERQDEPAVEGAPEPERDRTGELRAELERARQAADILALREAAEPAREQVVPEPRQVEDERELVD